MPTEEAVSQPGNSKSGVLSSVRASVRASVGALNLTGEPGRQEKAVVDSMLRTGCTVDGHQRCGQAGFITAGRR